MESFIQSSSINPTSFLIELVPRDISYKSVELFI